MKHRKRKMSMGDEDMGAIAKMEKGGIVKMMKGGKVGYKKGGLVEDILKLEGGGKSKGFPDLTGMSAEEMKTTVIEWVNADPDNRKQQIMQMLPELSSLIM